MTPEEMIIVADLFSKIIYVVVFILVPFALFRKLLID